MTARRYVYQEDDDTSGAEFAAGAIPRMLERAREYPLMSGEWKWFLCVRANIWEWQAHDVPLWTEFAHLT